MAMRARFWLLVSMVNTSFTAQGHVFLERHSIRQPFLYMVLKHLYICSMGEQHGVVDEHQELVELEVEGEEGDVFVILAVYFVGLYRYFLELP